MSVGGQQWPQALVYIVGQRIPSQAGSEYHGNITHLKMKSQGLFSMCLIIIMETKKGLILTYKYEKIGINLTLHFPFYNIHINISPTINIS